MIDYTTFYETPKKLLMPECLLWFKNRKRVYTDCSTFFNKVVPTKIPSQFTGE